MDSRKRIVIVGGGFAGFNFLKHIDKKRYDVTIVDKNNYHSFPPLFYQVVSSGLEPGSICFPLRREMRKGRAKGARFHMGDVREINTNEKYIRTEVEEIGYDLLVIAAGTTNNFFGNDSLEKTVFTLKSTSQAMRCRNEILDRLELASNCHDQKQQRKLLSFVVVGGGPAGVEIAGALGEMKRYILQRDYPSINQEDVRINLLEGTDRLLGAMTEKSQADAKDYLDRLLVDVKLGSIMKSFDGEQVELADGTTIDASMVIWTAGITSVKFEFNGPAPEYAKGGRIMVDEFNRVKGVEGVYALGDICCMRCEGYPEGHPQLAQVAIQQGRNLAQNLNKEQFERGFVYKDKGTMATVGRNLAVADLKHTHLRGRIAWLAWMFVHLMSILGMRNKLSVLIDWIWGYFSYSTSLRLLLIPSKYPRRRQWGEE